eukprot:6492147-Amphidinium_carterae.5
MAPKVQKKLVNLGTASTKRTMAGKPFAQKRGVGEVADGESIAANGKPKKKKQEVQVGQCVCSLCGQSSEAIWGIMKRDWCKRKREKHM